VPALPSPGSSRVREPLCADDDASVDADARFILSTVTILCLSHPGGYYCMSRRSRRELWITRGVARGQVPLCPCGGRNCGVDLSVENVDRPSPDQQRRSVLPAGVPSTSSTGHPRGACRDKAQRRGSASGHDSRVLDAETERHGALCTPGNPITCAVRTPPQGTSGRCPFVRSQRHTAPVFHRGAVRSGSNPASAAGPEQTSDAAAVVARPADPRPSATDGRYRGQTGRVSPPSGSAPGTPPEGEARTRLEVVADKLAPSLLWATKDHPDRDELSAAGRRPARRVVTGCGWVTGSA
jgi:hypothetical protein